MRMMIAQVFANLDIDGIRGDIVVNQAANSLLAFEGSTEVITSDIQ
jgi:magnesium chelatase subunit I